MSSGVTPIDYRGPPPPVVRGPGHRWKLACIFALTGIMAVLVLAHTPGVNGPWYWKWSWRRLPMFPLFPASLVAAFPFFIAQFLYARKKPLWMALVLICISTLALELTAISLQPHRAEASRLTDLIRSPYATSYYSSAVRLYRENISIVQILERYTEILPTLDLHARFKPPGPTLSYLLLIKLTGRGVYAVRTAGLLIALAAAAAPAATYMLVRFFARDRRVAFAAASFLALTPSLILFLPQLDQVYVSLACLLLVSWGMALRTGRTAFALCFGLLLAVLLLYSYVFLTLGVFLLGITIFAIVDGGRAVLPKVVRHCALATAALAGFYVLLYLATGFDPLATFQNIQTRHDQGLALLKRPFPLHVLFDLLDFALGTGWISYLLAGFAIASLGGRLFSPARKSRFALLAIGQILIVAIVALLPGEAARLWMLFMPLLAGVIGIELARWPLLHRVTVYACLWLIMVLICQNMLFLFLSRQFDTPQLEIKGWGLLTPSPASIANSN